ncbi:MAG: hypothetical protein A2275_18850 [Bacteroidetes bacterium RIFOXYA12_FULL_35_11]|nr:MAG: hypothetical protein A2X01_14480 [Bacteroidetes bacterium GWF2_35_48]OFY76842.1 MAG: hypothetical protein A2275_18850 [Bacteroidetes bacterium RIFOXYA12_FULL_35_11]OFY95819.1 MAG: hypothetical protein A2309_14605 [Bacteroidetes bacterium RIFOXYB2_FULL_35_7]
MQISEFVVGATAIFFNAYLSLQALKKINNKLTNVGKLYLIGLWLGKKTSSISFFYLKKQLNSKKRNCTWLCV